MGTSPRVHSLGRGFSPRDDAIGLTLSGWLMCFGSVPQQPRDGGCKAPRQGSYRDATLHRLFDFSRACFVTGCFAPFVLPRWRITILNGFRRVITPFSEHFPTIRNFFFPTIRNEIGYISLQFVMKKQAYFPTIRNEIGQKSTYALTSEQG